MTHRIKECRICGNKNFKTILDLGEQTLSGIFPDVPSLEHSSQLNLVQCDGEHSDPMKIPCGHIQLEETFSPEVMYGKDYGYRSGLNKSMVAHLKGRVEEIIGRFEENEMVSLEEDDFVLDIAGNDGTTLGFYPSSLTRVNIDPTSEKFKKYQPEGVLNIADFYSSDVLHQYFVNNDLECKPFKVITAFSMFYDLESPREFLMDVENILDQEGLIVFEQSYMPLMFKRMSFDTICHEHLSYFALKQFNFMFKQIGLKFVDISFNDCNGGSFVVTAARDDSMFWEENTTLLNELLSKEEEEGYHLEETWKGWESSIKKLRSSLKKKIAGKKVAGLGASTKGNVLLQYYGLGPEDIEVIGDVNPDKHGCYAPGSWIPIVSEEEVLAGDYDYYLVLPWHFKEFFINNPKFKGKTLLFPLPKVHTVTVE